MTQFNVVLVGAGHAHLHVIVQAGKLRKRGARLVVIDPGEFWYSGLATGMLGGMYRPEEDRIDVAALAARHGAVLYRDRVVGMDSQQRRLALASGVTIDYDLVSFNVGSEPDTDQVSVAADSVWHVKPIAGLARLREHFSAQLRRGEGRAVVIGGGATACEIAANLAALADHLQADAELTLLSRAPRLVPAQSPRVSRTLERALADLGIRIITGRAASHVEAGRVRCADGSSHEAATIVLATGLRAPHWLRSIGLACSKAGLQVDNTLRSLDDPRVFGAGDCIDFDGRALPKLGVFGVRQARILLENLCNTIDGTPLIQYRPQQRWLSILNLGRGDALMMRGALWWRGRLAMWLKDRLDRRFLARYRTGA